MLAKYHYQPLVADLPGQDLSFSFYLIKGKAAPFFPLIIGPEGAVKAVIDAVAAAVKRREGDDPVVIDRSLDLICGFKDFVPGIGIGNVEERSCFIRLKALNGKEPNQGSYLNDQWANRRS